MQDVGLLPESAISGLRAKPFLKWAGGKTQLIPEISKSIEAVVGRWDSFTYIEPFVGSGAVLFWFLKKYRNAGRVIINDINRDLMIAYRIIKDNPFELIGMLRTIERSYLSIVAEEGRREFYLSVRSRFNGKNLDEIENTALLIFLNRTCYNGLFRVNSKGTFNVPFGRYNNPRICDEATILADSRLLQRTEIMSGDFEVTLPYADGKTLFYFDPPYKPVRMTSSFSSYNRNAFGDKEHIRLRNFCNTVNALGYKFVLSNSDVKNFDISNEFFDSIYAAFNINRVLAKRMINSDPSGRGEIFELIIDNH
ncbi:MAG: DNA adenine methylase [Bacteroidales bacterium]|nr:DNA adenine methylase [Bacteroidales bacterium]